MYTDITALYSIFNKSEHVFVARCSVKIVSSDQIYAYDLFIAYPAILYGHKGIDIWLLNVRNVHNTYGRGLWWCSPLVFPWEP